VNLSQAAKSPRDKFAQSVPGPLRDRRATETESHKERDAQLLHPCMKSAAHCLEASDSNNIFLLTFVVHSA